MQPPTVAVAQQQTAMPPLHSLCLSPTPSPLPHDHHTASLSAKPSTPLPRHHESLLLHHHHPDLPLPLPDLPSHIKEKILSLEVMGVDSGRVLALNPALRDATPDSVNAVISFLRSKGIQHKDLARILGMCPTVLTSSIRTDLAPVFAFLARDLNVSNTGMRRVINKCPRLLASSARDQLRPALIYLQRLGFHDKEALAYQDPVLLVSSVERTLMPKLEFLVGLGLSWEEAVDMVLRCPALFTFSIERNFVPKYAYLVGEMEGGLEELKEFPQYFAFSLDKRIKPRHREMVERGTRLRLSDMLKTTDEEFTELVQKSKKIEM